MTLQKFNVAAAIALLGLGACSDLFKLAAKFISVLSTSSTTMETLIEIAFSHKS